MYFLRIHSGCPVGNGKGQAREYTGKPLKAVVVIKERND